MACDIVCLMLRNILPRILDTKCNNIRQAEKSLAEAVAFEVLGGYQAGVWDFIMPPLLVVNLLRHKRKREAFILNFLFTKKIALETARDMVERNVSRDAAMQMAEEATGKVLASDTKGVYADKVRQRQLREIELLAGHYYKLIITEGKTYEEMVEEAYSERREYLDFVRRLNQAEKEVNHAALATVGRNEASLNFINKMEKAVEKIRQTDADKYFPPVIS